MENGKDIEAVEAEIVQPIAWAKGLITVDDINRAETQVDGLKKIKSISLKLTNPSDWMMMDNKPCMQNSGTMKIANLWGVSFLKPVEREERRNDDKGEYITFTISGQAEFRGRTVEDIGTSSTRDPLFAGKATARLPLSEIDIQDVKKSAYTNWQSRILKKILGLSFELDDLKTAGIDIDRIKGFRHAEGGAGGGLISQPQANRLFMISKTAKISEDMVKTIIKGFGYEHSKDIKRTDYEAICKMVEDKGKALAAFDKGDQQPGD